MKLWNDKTYLFLTILSVLILGVINLPTPFFGDQAFFLLGAKEMNEGFVLYRDFWDIKQPGIFLFYLAGGKIFGFNEIGIHLFELFYWLGFSLILVWFLIRNHVFENKLLSYIAPVMIVGTYYSGSSPSFLTQVEALVSFPLLLVIIFNSLYKEGNRNNLLWLFLSGMVGGLTLYFKFIFAPILIIFWVVLFSQEIKTISVQKLILNFLIIAAGVIIIWLPFIFYCYSHHILKLCYNTFIVYPPLILQYGQIKDISHLLDSAEAFLVRTGLVLPFTLISILFIKRKFLLLEMVSWLIVSFFIIIIQKTSWYAYHFEILYVSAIIMALIGIDVFAKRFDFKKVENLIFFILFLLFINSFSFFHLAKKIMLLSKYNFALTAADKINYAISTSKHNAWAYNVSDKLNSEANDKCPIFVVDDPLVYYYTNRNQAIAQSGWSMQLFIPGQIETLYNELKSKKPCYIFIRSSFNHFFETRGKDVLVWIGENYMILNSDNDGIWYKLN